MMSLIHLFIHSFIFCFLDMNDCISNPCLNGATCTDLVGPGYTCICETGYTGNHCETGIYIY